MEFRDYTEIVFESGNVLSAKMLEETYRYPRDFLKVFHNKFCNGIVAGLDFETRDNDVYLTSGIVKMNGRFFILSEDVNLDEWFKSQNLESQADYCLFLNYEDVLEGLNFGISSQSRLTLQIKNRQSSNSLLLGKYRCRSDVGILLPSLNSSRDPFEEFVQPSFLQLLDAEYAHPRGGLTYHPLIFRAIQNYLEQKFPLSPYDFTLLTEIQNHGIVAKSTLKSYIAVNQKISSISDQMTNEEFFQMLVKCVQIPYKPMAQYESISKQNSDEIRLRRQSKLI